MLSIINQLKSKFSSPNSLTFDSLGQYVKAIDISAIDYEAHLPQFPKNGDYGRNIMLLEPLECVLLYWPPKCESAIHYHAGFWGYVSVIEGCGDNTEYKLKNGILEEIGTIRAYKGGIMNEPDGIIHKISNPSETNTLITIHFYYPALDNLNNLAIYSEDGRLGILNKQASCASFQEPRQHFKRLEENAFTFIPFTKSKRAKSHHILPVIPKPSCNEINRMIGEYYGEQAEHYDLFDFNDPSRRKYTEKINTIIAQEIDNRENTEQVLALASGTGRRASKIMELSQQNYQLTGVDLSLEMCEVAKQRGIDTIHSDWLNADLPLNNYDVCTFLYAFGHITTHESRLKALRKIANHLKKGGVLFFDVFNLHDKYEWGANALKTYQELQLTKWGYEQGDVFYKKTDGNEIAFLHYFDKNQLISMLENVGFKVEYIKHIGYVHRSGEILNNNDEGSLFIKALKI